MAVFGYCIYIFLALFSTLITCAVYSWPGNARGERIFMTVIFILFWTGAYWLWPFKPMELI